MYRTKANLHDHSKHQPSHWDMVYPRYFSKAPIPPLTANQFLAKVKLPKTDPPQVQTTTKIRIKVDVSKADDQIKTVVAKLKGVDPDPNNYMLKVEGREEYIYGPELISEHAAIREAVRNADDVLLALVKVPDKAKKVEEARVAMDNHIKTLDQVYPKNYSNTDILKKVDDSVIERRADFEYNGPKCGNPLKCISLFEHQR
eukprot:UN31722